MKRPATGRWRAAIRAASGSEAGEPGVVWIG